MNWRIRKLLWNEKPENFRGDWSICDRRHNGRSSCIPISVADYSFPEGGVAEIRAALDAFLANEREKENFLLGRPRGFKLARKFNPYKNI
jgi:hypothetical protein